MKSLKIAVLFALASLLCAGFLFAQSASSDGRSEFDHAALRAHDLKKTAAFYETVVGLERIADPFKDDRHVWFRIGAHEQLHVIAGATEVTEPDFGDHLAFRVASIPEFVSRLDRLHVKYRNVQGQEKAVAVRPDGVKQIYFQDPDGHWIEVNDHKP